MKYLIIIVFLFGCKQKQVSHVGAPDYSWDSVSVSVNKSILESERVLQFSNIVLKVNSKVDSFNNMQHESSSAEEYKRFDDSVEKYIKILKSADRKFKKENE